MIKKFTLGAVDWKVEFNNSKLDDRECYGESNYDQSLILLQDTTKGAKRAPTAIEQTLYHEVFHAILDTLGESKLSQDEEFVQKVAMLLHQFEKTKK